MKYEFDKPLIEGVIKSRPNRFLMEVELAGKIILCHCPVTGRIGDLVFSDIPCLISSEDKDSRRTKFTVEAISLNKIKRKRKDWIAINQRTVNDYVNFFIKNKFFPKMKLGNEIKREVALNSSRIDFCIDEAYLEIKMSLLEIKGEKHHGKLIHEKFNSFQRWQKQINDLSIVTRENNRALLCLVKTHNRSSFSLSDIDGKNSELKLLTKMINDSNIECWQINLQIGKKGISLINYFKLKSL